MGKIYSSDCLPAFILDLLSLLRGLVRLQVCSFRLPSIHFTVPNVQPLSNCYLFPYSGTGGLKFGTEVIDLILNMICKGFISLFPCSRRGISFFFLRSQQYKQSINVPFFSQPMYQHRDKKPGIESIFTSAFCYAKCSQVKQNTDVENNSPPKWNHAQCWLSWDYLQILSLMYQIATLILSELCYFRKKETLISGKINRCSDRLNSSNIF